jgi:O-antigen/teichoic acid export membrane protein
MKINKILNLFNSKSLQGASINLLIGQVIITATFLFFDMIITRKFSPEVFSTWKQFQILINLVLPLFAFGLPEGYKYYIAYYPEKLNFHTSLIVLCLLSLTILIFLLSIIIGQYSLAAYFHNPLLSNVAYLLAFLFLAISLNRLLRYQLININQTFIYLIGCLIAIVVGLLLMIVFSFNQNMVVDNNKIMILAAIVIVVFISPNVYAHFKFPTKLFPFVFDSKQIWQYVKIGFPLYLATFMAILISNIDKTIIGRMENLKAFGIYAAASIEIPIFSMLSASFSQSTFPKYVQLLKENKKKEAIDLWISITNKVSKITYPLLLLMMVFAKFIITFIYTEQLVAAVPLFKIFLLGCLWRNNFYGSMISASGNTKWISIYNFANLILVSSSCYFCYQFFGYQSLPWVLLSSICFINTAQLFHENMFLDFIKSFILKPYNLLFIILILLAFLYSPF